MVSSTSGSPHIVLKIIPWASPQGGILLQPGTGQQLDKTKLSRYQNQTKIQRLTEASSSQDPSQSNLVSERKPVLKPPRATILLHVRVQNFYNNLADTTTYLYLPVRTTVPNWKFVFQIEQTTVLSSISSNTKFSSILKLTVAKS